MILLKLGGSAITQKDRPETVDDDTLERAARALSATGDESEQQGDRDEDLVVVHGGGSFGHPAADRHGVTEQTGTREAAAVADVHGAMKRLNDRVVASLRAAGLPAVPVHPLSAASRDRAGELTLPTGQFETLVAEGFVPVTHGDGVAHRGQGVTVLSGDELVVALARALDPDRVGLCSTVPGVLRDGEVVDRVASFDQVADVLGRSGAAADVTGGMAGKVRRLLDLSAPAAIFGPDDLAGFVAGRPVGTVVE